MIHLIPARLGNCMSSVALLKTRSYVIGLARSCYGSLRMFVAASTAVYVTIFWRRHARRASRHNLPGSLTVTMTSFPPRYRTLALTLKSLLSQSLRPDRVCLWLAPADVDSLPENVLHLRAHGLTIRACEDFRAFKKIIPAIEAYANDFLVVADDDVYYPRHWLRELVAAYRPGSKEIVCTRAHRIRLTEQGLPLPYLQWNGEIPAGEGSELIFPTGTGGVLYEPGIFHPHVTRVEIFRNLCPSSDDIWLYWMASLNGARFRKVGPQRRFLSWVGSQRVTLCSKNCAPTSGQGITPNDEQIANMISHYGFPHARAVQTPPV